MRCWLAALVSSLLLHAHTVFHSQIRRNQELKIFKSTNDPEEKKVALSRVKDCIKYFRAYFRNEKDEWFGAVCDSIDVLIPLGVLGWVNPGFVGACGTVTSVLGLYKVIVTL